MKRLSHLIGDKKDTFGRDATDARFFKIVSSILFATNCALVGALIMVTCRDPFVLVKDRTTAEPVRLTRAEKAPPITEADARLFFVNMLKLRHGWDSMTMLRDLAEFRSQCHSDQRKFEHQYLDEKIVPNPEEPDRKVSRKQHWVASQIKNTLILPENLDDVSCKLVEGGTWSCYVTATVVTQKLFPPYLPSPMQHRSTFVASLLPLKRHTVDLPYGLIVGLLRELPPDTKGAST